MSEATPPPEPATSPPVTAASTTPATKSPGDRLWELLQLAGQFKSWLVSVIAAAVSLWAAIKWGRELGEWQWVAIAGGAAPMLIAGLCNLLPETLRILRDRRLRRWAVDITEAKPGYFRLWPWTEEDRDRFSRPDLAERRILQWIQSAEQPLLYLTGSSGSGKSSLLNAHVIPELRDAIDGTQYVSLVVRSFDDTLADLKKQLLDPQASWHDPELSKKRKLHTLLQAVCESLQNETIPRRLLLVLDQFEELMILHELDDPRFAGVREFLTGLVEKPVPGLTMLLTLRSDYEHLLEKLGLPPQDRGGTWEKVDPLRATEVRRFLTHSDSGINPQPDVLNAVIEEAQVVDGTQGLIRPIVMNMLGRVLQSRAGETPREFEPGTLLSRYLRESIESSDKSDHLPAILAELVQKDAGTKRPRTVGEVSTQIDRDPYLVHGCLRELSDLGLVRPLTRDADVQDRTWEVAHDFIARLLVPILETPRRTLWQKTRPLLTPLALVIWLVVFPGVLWNYMQDAQLRIKSRLSNLEVTVKKLETENAYRATFANKDVVSIDEHVSLLVAHGGITELDLSGCDALMAADVSRLISLQTLDLSRCVLLPSIDVSGLNSLQTLNLVYCGGLESLDASTLASLQALILFGSGLQESLDLSGLASLQTLNLSGLTSLQTLNLSGCELLPSLDVSGLTKLQTLDLSHCLQLSKLKAVGTPSLKLVDLSNASTFNDVAALRACEQLVALSLAGCTSVKDLSPLSSLQHLRLLHLRGLDERVIATGPPPSDTLSIDVEITDGEAINRSLRSAVEAAEAELP